MSTTIKNWKRRNISPRSIKTSIIAQLCFFCPAVDPLHHQRPKTSFDFRDLLAGWLKTYTAVDRISANSLWNQPPTNKFVLAFHIAWGCFSSTSSTNNIWEPHSSFLDAKVACTVSRSCWQRTLLGALLTGNYIHFSSRQVALRRTFQEERPPVPGVPRFAAKNQLISLLFFQLFQANVFLWH